MYTRFVPNLIYIYIRKNVCKVSLRIGFFFHYNCPNAIFFFGFYFFETQNILKIIADVISVVQYPNYFRLTLLRILLFKFVYLKFCGHLYVLSSAVNSIVVFWLRMFP